MLLDNSGLIQAFAPGEVLHRLMTEIAMAVYNAHTHPAPNGTTGVAEPADDSRRSHHSVSSGDLTP